MRSITDMAAVVGTETGKAVIVVRDCRSIEVRVPGDKVTAVNAKMQARRMAGTVISVKSLGYEEQYTYRIVCIEIVPM